MERSSVPTEMNNPAAARQVVKQECLVSVIEAANDGTEWATDFITSELDSKNAYNKQQCFLHCGRCVATVAFELEECSVTVWPPGCELGNTLR